MERMVRIRNTINSTVVVNRPEYNIRREWTARGQVQQIPFDTVQQLLFTTGFSNLIKSGTLYIENMKDKIDLGLEEPETTKPTLIRCLDDAEMQHLLTETTFEEFVQELAAFSMDQAQLLVDYAVDHEIIEAKKVSYLKKLTGRDVMLIIARKREAAEIDRQMKEPSRARGF